MASLPPDDHAQLYKVLAETALDAIVVIDESSMLLSINPAGETLFGYPAHEVLGRPLTQLMPERLRADHVRGMRRFLDTGTHRIPWRGVRLPILTRDGREVATEISFAELQSDGRRIFSGIIRDISERVATEEALADSAAQLQEQASELEQQVEEAQTLSEDLEETNQQLLHANEELEVARDSAALLADASALLASSTDYTQTLSNVARAVVPRLGDWAAVDLLEDPDLAAWPPRVRRVAVVHDDPAKLALARELTTKYPERWDDGGPRTSVLRDGRSMFVPVITADMFTASAQDAEQLRLMRALDFHSVIIVPIVARDRVLGALTLCMTESARHYTPTDLETAQDLGRRAGVAIDTAWLLQGMREAREAAEASAARTARLQEVTALLAGALTEREVADAVIDQGVPAFGAIDGAIYLLSEDGQQLVHAASAGLSERTTQEFRVFPLAAPLPLSDAVRTGQSVVLETREEIVARYPALRDANSRATTVSWIAVPLRAGETTLGGMALGFADERRFSADDVAFAETLARLCAQALLRARLYDEAERARAAAEEADAVKLAFLATMSHELRTPLNAIAGHVQLMEMELLGPISEPQQDALRRVNRAQAHLLGLINDVLTYARVDSGRIEYALAPVDAAALAREVCLLVKPQFIEKGLELLVEAPGSESSPVRVLADEEKLTQILLNLLSNALKFTPAPGRVTVAVGADPAAKQGARIVVRDTGVGIPEGKLESVFEPFVQLGRGLTTAHQGTGLGLSISRDLARGMGGDLTATSGESGGASFSLTLPRESD